MKRFYQSASCTEEAGGFSIRLDGRPVKTPAGQPLVLSSRALAEAVAAEWAAQGDTIQPDTMPMMRLAATMLDRIGPNRAAIEGELARFIETDLLCYRAGDDQPDLAARQAALWQPVLDWLSARHGLTLTITSGLMPVAQDVGAVDRIAAVLADLPVHGLTVAAVAVPATGSLALGLALVDGRISAAEAYALSQVDETFQAEAWGEDWEAADRRAALKAEIEDAARFLSLCDG